MVLIININKGIKEFTCGYQDCNISHILLFGGYVEVRDSLYTRVVISVNDILNHIDTRMILVRCECSCMVYRPE